MKEVNRKLTLATAIGGVLMLSSFTTVNAADTRGANLRLDTGHLSIVAESSDESDGIYLVRLANPAIATYDGGIKGLPATSAQATGKKRLDTKSRAATNYKKFLEAQQEQVLIEASEQLGRELDTKYTYQWATNGFAVLLTAEEAKTMRNLPGVVSVQREQMEQLMTDAGPAFIGAPSIWNNTPAGSRGEGVVVAILDTGINHSHPSFADVGGDGYDHTNPLGSGNYVPGSYCDAVDPTFCNDKLIGAWDFVASDGTVPEDNDGHGSHTASTTAGNVVYGAQLVGPTTDAILDISGVAPHGNIIAYDVCDAGCPGSALAAAIDQVVIDAGNLPNGIAALNYSISGGGSPYSDYVELGFLAAVQAGIYVAASAGNSGPGASTVAHLGPWVSTTAASTHDRAVLNSVVDINSSGGGMPDITGKGFTAGYGPAPIINSADLEGTYPGATLCAPGSFPPATFNGEIVACTRGTFGRVEKGQVVMDAGAGGYILMDTGGGLSADAHVLPGVHISQADSAALVAWLATNAGNNPMASISGYVMDTHPANGDVMAGFSSRGPQLVFDVLKPDVTAPGVDVMAAAADGHTLGHPDYQLLSGTSMSSPHNAGAGALMTAMRPDLTPQEIKSAIMLSSTTANTVKEDGFTPTDAFDLGAGRVDLHAAKSAGLVLSETTQNFMDANPALGGDPSTLNLASMMSSNCVGTCSWTRTLRNPEKSTSFWNVTAGGDDFDAEVALLPAANGADYNLKLKKGQSAEVTVTADTSLLPDGWYFGTVDLDRNLDQGPDLHMPIAVYASKATDANVFTKTVDKDTATAGDILNYEINITNGPYDGLVSVADMEPEGATFVPGSASVSVSGGSTVTPVAISGDLLTWSGMLDVADVTVVSDPFPPAGSPFGYLHLSSFGVLPLTCSSICDDSSVGLILPPFVFDGQVYTGLRMGSNGLIVPTTGAIGATSPFNQDLPNAATPNPIAPFWTDLDLDGTDATDTGAGKMYAATALSGAFTILSWEGVEEWNVPGPKYTFQVQIGNVGSGYEGIWFVYNQLDAVPPNLTVGAEDVTGSRGNNYYYNGTGTFPITGDLGDLKVSAIAGGSATITFQAEADCDGEGIVNEAELNHGSDTERAIAVTLCE